MIKPIFTDIFPRKKPIIGVVRLLPLLGYKEFPGISKIIETALEDLYNLEKADFDGALVDNHTHPHVVKATPEMVASFTTVMIELVKKAKIPLGVQFLIDDPEASLAIAKASGASFIRTDFLVDRVKTKYGIMEPRAKQIVAYRKKIHGEDILIFADVQVKHAEMLDKKKPISASVKQALLAGADAVVITGSWTGVAPEIAKLNQAKKAAEEKPVLVGSGFSVKNAKALLAIANGALVGTSIRNESRIDYSKAQKMMKQMKRDLKVEKKTNNEIEGHKLIDLEPFLDFQELKKFWEIQGIDRLSFIASGHMNLTWTGRRNGKEVICQFGPSLKNYQASLLQGKKSCGYFHPDKYLNAQKICRRIKNVGVPCPEIIKAGYSQSFTRAWCIVQKASGENLNSFWSLFAKEKKIKILAQVGSFLGKLHSLPVEKPTVKPQSWYEIWFNQVSDNLQILGIYGRSELMTIKSAVLPKFFADWLPPGFALIHGDLLQKNIFIKPKSSEITGIIDWETAGIGNPWSDVVLTAWWLSGEDGGDDEEYEAVINGYNNGLTDKRLLLSFKKAKLMNPYLDILWYLNILWVRSFMGDNSQTLRRKKMVKKILLQIN